MVSVLNDGLYVVKIKCAVCGKEIDVVKVKSKACRIKSRDSDFCVYYETINPLFYDIWICDFCGYAKQKDKFDDISEGDRSLLNKYLVPKWVEQNFNTERDVSLAIKTYKLALANLQVINAEPIEFAKICLRTGWLYRIKKDTENERKFLEYSLKAYKDAFNKADFPIGKLTEGLCMYIIAEISRRVDKMDESLKWFGRSLSHKDIRNDSKLLDLVQEQSFIAKKRAKELKKMETV
jgi:uncharacterized protein (DUF2225 family)